VNLEVYRTYKFKVIIWRLYMYKLCFFVHDENQTLSTLDYSWIFQLLCILTSYNLFCLLCFISVECYSTQYMMYGCYANGNEQCHVVVIGQIKIVNAVSQRIRSYWRYKKLTSCWLNMYMPAVKILEFKDTKGNSGIIRCPNLPEFKVARNYNKILCVRIPEWD
jgi:hypothetical protein